MKGAVHQQRLEDQSHQKKRKQELGLCNRQAIEGAVSGNNSTVDKKEQRDQEEQQQQQQR